MEGHPFRDAPATTRKLASTKLESGNSPLKNFLVFGVFTVVWNSIVALIFASAVASGETFFTLFSSIFLLVGIGLVIYASYLFLAIFNPTIEIHVSEGLPALGDTIDLRWKIRGSASRIRALKVELVGMESATYRRGTDTTTDVEVFETVRIAHTDDPREIAEGAGTVVIPAGGVPSFTAKHNLVLWVIKIEAEIPRWPDLEDTFEVAVVASKPHRAQRQAA